SSKLFLTTAASSRKITSEDINGGGTTHNPSFRVYYGGSPVAVAVPFTWESAPGTPKHCWNFGFHDDDDNLMPPLTPPPSFYSAASMNSNSSAARNPGADLGGNYWSSSSSSSTSSSGRDSADVYMSRRKKKKPRLMSRWFFCSGRRLAVADGDHRW
ncbi:hypothetical protein LINPERHAP1_LOCUS41051, partial [Linum perenne]